MEDILSFEKGYMPDIDVLKLPKGAYLDALNMIRDESGNLISEPGTKAVISLATGYSFVGSCMIGNDIVLAMTNGTESQIGILKENEDLAIYVDNPALEFSVGNHVEIESKINYKGERVIYIAGKGIDLRAINLDDLPNGDFDKTTKLFVEYDLPISDLGEVTTGGSVLSGSYQFAARLVTGSNNTTAFGPLSGIIPIAVGEFSEGRKNITGAPPQTGTRKAISMTLRNIDTSFEFVEPCVITYEGTANVLTVRSLGKREINNQSELTFTYSGTADELEEVLAAELNLDTVAYDSAEHIVQKDNTLIISNLVERNDTYDWQKVANKVMLTYKEKRLPFSESISMQRNGDTFWDSLSDDDKKGLAQGDSWTDVGILGGFDDYKNPETCYKFRGYRRDETYSFTFTPIFKGGRRGDAYHIPAMTSSTATSLGGNPQNILGRSITADHQYPPNFDMYANQSVVYHKMPNNVSSPAYIKDGSEYIVALGVEATILGSTSEWKDLLDGYIIGRENRSGRETVTAQGFSKDIYEISSGDKYGFMHGFGACEVVDTNGTNIEDASLMHKKIFTFHSPDILTNPSLDYIPSKIERIFKYNAKYMYADTGSQSRKINNSFISCAPGNADNTTVSLVEGVTAINTQSNDPEDNYRNQTLNQNLSLNLFGETVEYKRTMGCVALKASEDLPRNRDFLERFNDNSDNTNAKYTINNVGEFQFDLYNLKVDRPNYYGDIYNKVSESISTVLFNAEYRNPISGEIMPDNRTVFFNGDTFISKYAVTLKTTGPYYGGNTETNQDIPVSNTLVYIMVESNNNYNFRHYIDGSNVTSGTVPFYPKYPLLQQDSTGINDLVSGLGNSVQYNKQYSAENSLRPTYSRTIDEDRISVFTNRAAYSATSIEGENFDAFRLFLPANYHDIPKQFGEITGMFVQGNDLMVHTERSLWKTFFNTLATQATSVGDIVLGNGGAFNRPSVPLVTLDGGYAGCKSIKASVATPSGRYFLDSHKSKLYYLGEGLKEISNPVLFKEMRKLAHNKDFTLGYDYGRKRIILSADGYTRSYSPELNSFNGRHSYNIDNLISRDITDYVTNGNNLEKFDESVVGSYFSTKAKAKVTVPSIVSPTISKRYVSGYVILRSTNSVSGINEPFKFFSSMKAYSLERNTGFCELEIIRDTPTDFETVGRVFVHKANNKFRFDIPQDIVHNIELDVQEPSNHMTDPRFTDEERMFLPDMIDDHMVFEFGIDNDTNSIIKINSIIINFEQNID